MKRDKFWKIIVVILFIILIIILADDIARTFNQKAMYNSNIEYKKTICIDNFVIKSIQNSTNFTLTKEFSDFLEDQEKLCKEGGYEINPGSENGK